MSAASVLASPTTPAERCVTYLKDKIFEVKLKLANEGVMEDEYASYMPGVIATNLGAPLPVPHCGENGPVLPKGLMAKEVYNKKSLELIKKCADANTQCSETFLQTDTFLRMEKLKSIPKNDHELTRVENQLAMVLNHAGYCLAKKSKFYLDFAPVNAEAFYAKITPLFNEYNSLAERLRDAQRDLE